MRVGADFSGKVLVLLFLSFSAQCVAGSYEAVLELRIYTGGAPWEPQINFHYDSRKLEYSYTHDYEDEIFGRHIVHKAVREVDKITRLKIHDKLTQLDLFSLEDDYKNELIAGGITVVIELSSGGETKVIRVENQDVPVVEDLLRFVNTLGPKDIQLMGIGAAPFARPAGE